MKKDYFKYLAGLLLFGSNGLIASKIPLASADIVFLRSVLGGVFLLGLFLLTGHRFQALKHRRDLLFIALSGVAMAADWLFLFEAYARIGVSLSILINYTGPAITMVIALLVFRERLTLSGGIALLAALLGAVLINGVAAGNCLDAWGLICAVLSAVSYALMVIFNKCARKVAGMENAVLQLLFTALTVSVYTGLRNGYSKRIPADAWPWILWLGIINTGLGCFFYFSSIGSLPVQTVSILGYLEPLSAVLFAVIFLRESLSAVQWLGASLIIGGAILGEWSKSWRKMQRHQDAC